MYILIIITIIGLIGYYKYSKNKFTKKLTNPTEWNKLIVENNLTKKQQQKLCSKYHLPYFNDTKKQFDSIEQWERI